MKKQNKKGFTVVELVIVIAVVAVLASVLIPTFASLIQRAKLSSDQVAVKNMNTILSAEEAYNGKPRDAASLKRALRENGYAESLLPVTFGHKFYWDSKDNVIYLVDCTQASERVVYPNGYTWDAAAEAGRYVPLDGIPTASVTAYPTKTPVNLHDMSGNDLLSIDIDTGLKFACTDTAEELAQNDYKEYNADFVVTFSKQMTYVNDGDNQDGEVGFMLIGKYTYYMEGNPTNTFEWIPLEASKYSGVANDDGSQTIRTLKDMMGRNLSYAEVHSEVKEFECAIVAVYDNRYSETFTEFDNQVMDEEDAKYLNGLEVTVDLCLFDPDTDERFATVNTYKCRYRVTGSGTDEDPYKLICEEVK